MTDALTYITKNAVRIALFIALGVAIAGDGLRKRHKGEEIQTWQWLKTLLIGLVAGLLASTQAANPSGTAVSLFLAVATKLVNSAWDTYLPPKFGGSNTHGFGAELEVDLRETNPLIDQLFAMIMDVIDQVLDRKLDERFDAISRDLEAGRVGSTTTTGTSGNDGGPDDADSENSDAETEEVYPYSVNGVPNGPSVTGSKSDGSEDVADPTQSDEAQSLVAAASYETLVQVAKRLEGVKGSTGSGGIPETKLRETVYNVARNRPDDIIGTFEAVEGR